MERWRRVWRDGIAPLLSHSQRLALQDALRLDDPQLLQGRTSAPPALEANKSRAVEGACAIGWCGWRGDGLRTVGEVEAFFERLCADVDAACNEPAACRYFLNWYDDTPRAMMRRELLAEVTLLLDGPLQWAA